MTNSFYLICVLALCSFHFPSIAQAQFLADTTTNTAENDLSFNQNTPQEIQTSLSENIGKILNAFGSFIITKADSSQAPDAAFVHALGSVLVDYSNTIGDALGKLGADGVSAFREAQTTGQDKGAAVGAVLADSLRKLNNNAQDIGDAVQQKFDTVFVTFRDVISEVQAKAFESIGENFKRGINALANRADIFGEIVAHAVNDAVNEGGSTAEQLGGAFVDLLQGLEDFQDTDAYEEILREIINEPNAQDFIKILDISAEEFRSPVIQLIEDASREAGSPVEVIDNIAHVLLLYLSQI